MDSNGHTDSLQHTRKSTRGAFGRQQRGRATRQLEEAAGYGAAQRERDPAPLQPEETRDSALSSFEAELDALISELESERAASDESEDTIVRLPAVRFSSAPHTPAVRTPGDRSKGTETEEHIANQRDVLTAVVDAPP